MVGTASACSGLIGPGNLLTATNQVGAARSARIPEVQLFVDLLSGEWLPGNDGAQIAGWFDLDLEQLGVDFFTFAGHKGLQAPWGIGGLYVAENTSMKCPNASCEFDPSKRSEFGTQPGYCDAGSVDLIALAGLAAGFAATGGFFGGFGLLICNNAFPALETTGSPLTGIVT